MKSVNKKTVRNKIRIKSAGSNSDRMFMNKNRFSGVDIQEYDEKEKCLKGPNYRIFQGSDIGKTEGPNLLKRGDYYYLTCAEGGTEFGHCVTVARSKNITGPYEIDPNNPMLTSNTTEDYPLQRAGHGQLVEAVDGKWYMAHLCSRPVDGCSILGRETGIQNIIWTEDGWFRLEKGGNLPNLYFSGGATCHEDIDKKDPQGISVQGKIQHVEFNKKELPWEFMTLRESATHCGLDLQSRSGWLRIHGGNSLSSKYFQAFTARRQQAFLCDAMTKVEFNPRDYHHLAGLVCYYNYDNYYYLKITRDEKIGRCIQVTSMVNKEMEDSHCISIPEEGPVFLKAEMRRGELKFYFSMNGKEYNKVNGCYDMHTLSDERVSGNGFTGAMIGISCQDLQGNGVYADFNWFDYIEYE